ncbi:hypothetical protein Ocin01_18756 [Orchesella cincta]|uniref:Uncharacterized protein n=1 Tax=Orchesella cincta TaxID=48709 RepID=A0A1D2M4M6_ORCCI|nr:hypothetical protein Ocin01_18756 [Orchesella cincta]
MSSDDGSEVFCEKCELVLINPICQVYSQLLATQLRLSWELECSSPFSVGNIQTLIDNEMSAQKNGDFAQVFVERLMLVHINSELHSNQDEPSVKLESDEFDDNLSLEIPTTSEEIDVKLEIAHEPQEFSNKI